MAATTKLALEGEATTHQQQPNPPGALQLVGRPTQKINGQLAKIDRQVAQNLHRINVQQHPRPPATGPDRLKRLEAANLVLAPDHRDQTGWRHQQAIEGVEIKQSLPIHRHRLDAPTALLQLGSCRQRGGMLDRRYHQPAGCEASSSAEQGQMNGLGTTGGHHQFIWLAAQPSGQAQARAFEQLCCCKARAVEA